MLPTAVGLVFQPLLIISEPAYLHTSSEAPDLDRTVPPPLRGTSLVEVSAVGHKRFSKLHSTSANIPKWLSFRKNSLLGHKGNLFTPEGGQTSASGHIATVFALTSGGTYSILACSVESPRVSPGLEGRQDVPRGSPVQPTE